MLPQDVRAARFKRSRADLGYALRDVDDYRDRAESRLLNLGARVRALTDHNVALATHEDVRITRTLSLAVLAPAEDLPGPTLVDSDLKPGYDREQVDAFVLQVSAEVRRLDGLLGEQRERNAALVAALPADERPDYAAFTEDPAAVPTATPPSAWAALLGAVVIVAILVLCVLLVIRRG